MRRPQILEEAGFDIYVDDSKLRDLPLPIECKDLNDFIWCFDLPVWEKDGTDDWNLTPWEVINESTGSFEHKNRVDVCNLEYPIVIIFHKNKWVPLDGIHRLVKVYLLGHKTIDVKVLSKDSEYFKKALRPNQ